MLITQPGLETLIKEGVLRGVDPEHINAASIDITLGPILWAEKRVVAKPVDLANKESPELYRINMDEDGIGGTFALHPGVFMLAHSREEFYLPDDIAAEFKLKSSLARAGLEHSLAGWCDPGWSGSVLTLEIRNVLKYHTLQLSTGMKIGQMVFWRGEKVAETHSYSKRGRYNNDKTATPSKGVE